jgi:hypothetical protein
MPGMGIVVAAQSGHQVQSSVNATFVKGTSPSNSYFTVNVAVTNASPSDGRGHSSDANNGNSNHGNSLYVGITESLNGQSVGAGSCEISYHGDQSATCTTSLTFAGGGTYDFFATVYGHDGQVLSVSSYDPLVEPEW